MKGKIFNIKLICALLVALMASFCVCVATITSSTNQVKFSTAVEIDGEEYSAWLKDSGNVIFSVEKVEVASSEKMVKIGSNDNYVEKSLPEQISSPLPDRTFLTSYGTINTYKHVNDEGFNAAIDGGLYEREDDKFVVTGDINYVSSKTYYDNPEQYTFNNIPNGEKRKTVIDNGDFVRLDNIKSGDDYKTENGSSYQEAIMVSIGMYVYDKSSDSVKIANSHSSATDIVSANIHTFNYITIKLNGSNYAVPTLERSFNGCVDLCFLILQDDNNEGLYEISFEYITKGGVVGGINGFTFNLVNQTSYTQNLNPGVKDFGYNAKPTLGWTVDGNTAFAKNENYSIGKNFEGNDNIPYPTITYDYTKYNLRYSHTANDNNTKYNLFYNLNKNDGSGNSISTVTIEGKSKIDGTTSREFKISYDPADNVNLITIMFTKPGSYLIEYDFLYNGEIIDSSNVGFKTEPISFNIYGMNLVYSKEGFENAKLQYWEIAHNSNNNVSLVIPEGHKLGDDLSDFEDEKLGFLYTLKEVNNDYREGNILNKVDSKTIDSLMNNYLEKTEVEKIAKIHKFKKDPSINISTFIDEYIDDNLLDKIKYAETNQQSVSVDVYNDTYTTNSFYVTSSTEILPDDFATGITVDEVKTKSYTNTTTFNSKGYYILFLEIKPAGSVDDSNNFWQVFAFRTTSSSIDIKLEALKDDGTVENTVANGKYTNKKVRVSWVEPGVFDRVITPYVYAVNNENWDNSQVIQNGENVRNFEINRDNGIVYLELGGEVQDGTFKQFVVRLRNEGDSLTDKSFTIDKVGISGIVPYVVREGISGGEYYYSIVKNNGVDKAIENLITDSYATLKWDNKKSGAKTFATFDRTPFDTSTDSNEWVEGEFITTKYTLGSTITGDTFVKPKGSSNLSSDSVLLGQGIYVFHIWDEAGNETYYSFVIDRTENYFRVTPQDRPVEFLSNEFGIYACDAVGYNAEQYKAIQLNANNPNATDMLTRLVQGDFDKIDNCYSLGDYQNKFKSLFKVYNSKNYLMVQNQRIIVTDEIGVKVSESTMTSSLNYSESLEGATSLVRRYYIQGANNLYSAYNEFKDWNYVNLEINKDAARGFVYYSDGQIDKNSIPEDGKMNDDGDPATIFRMYTGSDGDGYSGMLKANATNANNLVFVWEIANVKELSYSYYILDPNQFNKTDGGKYYFYHEQSKDINLFESGKYDNGAEKLSDGERAFIKFDGKDGLYIVSRTLNDDTTLNYYFIIDRKGIITSTTVVKDGETQIVTDVGANIRFELMDGESGYDNFIKTGLDNNTLEYSEDFGNRDNFPNYKIYLTTTKIPATIKIPEGKFFKTKEDGGYNSSAGYTFGKLNVQVYFYDKHKQLYDKDLSQEPFSSFKSETIKIFDSESSYDDFKYNDYISDGFFNIDIFKYLSLEKVDNGLFLKSRLSLENNGQWIFLPGVYIIRLSDKVLGDENEKFIAIEINSFENAGPKISAYTGFEDKSVSGTQSLAGLSEVTFTPVAGSKYEYTATVNQEFLKIQMPKYENVNTEAETDTQYLVISPSNNKGTALKQEYKRSSGQTITLSPDSDTIINLDTLLARTGSAIDLKNSVLDFTYTIKVRYKLNGIAYSNYSSSTIEDLTKYEDCYVYYQEGTKVSFYEVTYKIKIDRQAPKQNINNLNLGDGLVKDYLEEQDVDSMFEDSYVSNSSLIYFTTQYAKYYQEGSKSEYIYAYKVTSGTKFDTTDVRNVIVTKIGENINSLASHKLELPNNTSGTGIDPNRSNYTYGDFIPLDGYDGYYEIIERDYAGNQSQYVVYYSDDANDPAITIPLNVTTSKNETETKELNLTDEIELILLSLNDGKEGVTSSDVQTGEGFFKILLEKVGVREDPKVWLTNAKTNLNELRNEIVSTITPGLYKFVIMARNYNESKITSKTHIIQLVEEDIPLNITSFEAAIMKDGIANFAYLENVHNNTTYFAPKIMVDNVEYIGKFNKDNGQVQYYKKELGGEVLTNGTVTFNDKNTHIIIITDFYTGEHPVIFNLDKNKKAIERKFIANGEEFNFNEGVIDGEYAYYSYTDIIVDYDKTIYDNVIVQIEKSSSYVTATPDSDYTKSEHDGFVKLTFSAADPEMVKKYKVIFECSKNSKINDTQYFIIDNRMPNVVIRDNSGQAHDIIVKENNINYDQEITVLNVGIGTLNLILPEIEDNDYFEYEFLLYELQNGIDPNPDFYGDPIKLNAGDSRTIITAEDNPGVYRLVINVYPKGEEVKNRSTLIGNRVYAFEVQAVSREVFHVKNGSEKMEGANSHLLPEEWNGFSFDKYVNIGGFTEELPMLDSNYIMPLYIGNDVLSVTTTMPNVKTHVVYSSASDPSISDYVLNIIAVYNENLTFVSYIATMQVKSTQKQLVKDVKITKNNGSQYEEFEVEDITSFTIGGYTNDVIKIVAEKNINQAGLLAKNKIQIEVWYTVGKDINLLEIVDYDFVNGYQIMGNGQYKLIFRDLAGNIHGYIVSGDDEDAVIEEELDVYILREIILSVNGLAPVQNAFYNDVVSISPYMSSKYVTGSFSLVAYRNGEPYIPTGSNPYKFLDYGTYRVVAEGKFLDKESNKEIPLSKVLIFTIINVNEARTNIDLTALSGHEIKKVLNPIGIDVTDAFVKMLEERKALGGMDISYQDLMKNASALQVTTGKLTFTLTYIVNDGKYPEQEIVVAFTLNNEIPSIPCTLKKGDSTTKSFSIYFNPSIIYEQIGEAYVYVNDKVVAHITEASPNQELYIQTSFKANGAGNYYVRLVSSSGTILDSYKVTIKEPLNFWAIIVIIAIVAVVTTVVVTVIVLRRKMRIR